MFHINVSTLEVRKFFLNIISINLGLFQSLSYLLPIMEFRSIILWFAMLNNSVPDKWATLNSSYFMITKNAPLLSQPNLEINMHTLIISKCTNMQICKTVTITSTNHCCSQKAQWAKTLNLRDALTRSVMGVFDCHNFMGGGVLKTHCLKPEITFVWSLKKLYMSSGTTKYPKVEESTCKTATNMCVSFI